MPDAGHPGAGASRTRALAWAVWLGVILASTILPLDNFKGHSHWAKVVWIPFGDQRLELIDIAGNMLLFVPMGWWWPFTIHADVTRHVARVAGAAALLSSSTESWQVYCHNRIPSATDVVTNVIGAVLGGLAAYAVTRSRARRTAS